MNKLSRELKNEIESLHLDDYDRGSWGAATSTPYRVKTYLTPAQSERIKAAYEALRGRVEAKLANEGFTSKAPAAVIEGERQKLEKYREVRRGLEEALAKLG